MDRYNHDFAAGEDTDEMDDSPLFGSFNSYSPQYRKQHYSNRQMLSHCGSDELNSSNSSINEAGKFSATDFRKLNVIFKSK